MHPLPPERLISYERADHLRDTGTDRSGRRTCPTVVHYRRNVGKQQLVRDLAGQEHIDR
jgi:hypothetical protein